MTDHSALRPDAFTPKRTTATVLGFGVVNSSMDPRTRLPLSAPASRLATGVLFRTHILSVASSSRTNLNVASNGTAL